MRPSSRHSVNEIGLREPIEKFVPSSNETDEHGVGILTGAVSDFVASISYDQIPRDVVEHVKLLILDNIGCMIGGAQLQPAVLLREHLVEIGRQGGTAVFGTDVSLPVPLAGYANAYSACLLSFDDSHIRLGHLGTAIIPGALAVAQELELSGRDVITAVTVGYEMALRLGEAIWPTPARASQVLGFATWQIFGCVAAAARLRGFSRRKVADAFGLAMAAAPVPFLRKFSSHPLGWQKNNLGWTTFGALNAVSLAEKGFVGNRTAFDGDDGFWVMAGSDRFRPAEMVDRLGEVWRVREVGFKPYGCCQWAHSSIEALQMILREYEIDGASIHRVQVEIAEDFIHSMSGPYPTNHLEAEFHIPFILALEIAGLSSSAAFSENSIHDPTIISLAQKVSVTSLVGASERFHRNSELPSRVTVVLHDNISHSREVLFPAGSTFGNEFGPGKIIDKFIGLSTSFLGANKASCVKDTLVDFESYNMNNIIDYNNIHA